MSTPPRVDLPAGVSADRWSVRGGRRAVLHTQVVDPRAWAVLVPGFTGSKEDFIAVLPALAERGVTALSYDHLGQHESDGSADPADYDLARLAADLGEVVAQAGLRLGVAGPPHLVGHSFGGLVAKQALLDGAVAPASYVALCSGPGALPAERWRGLPDLVDALPHTDLSVIWSVVAAAADGPKPPPEVAAFLERRWLAHEPMHLRVVAGHLMLTPDMSAELSRAVADVPVTVMWGEHDDAWPIDVQRGLAGALRADAVEIPGVGHSPNAEDPELLADLLLRAWR
jgi:pimeloyl-ACP methyl ester carboxylesterase